MGLIRMIARPALAAPFILQGFSALRHPAKNREQVNNVGVFISAIDEDISDKKKDMIIRATGVVQVVAGVLLSVGKFQKLSGAVLATTQLPIALGKNPVWAVADEDAPQAREGLVTSLALAGGALLAVADNKGRPSLGYRYHAWKNHRQEAKEAGHDTN